MPAGCVSSSSTLQVFWDRSHLWWLFWPPVHLLSHFPRLLHIQESESTDEESSTADVEYCHTGLVDCIHLLQEWCYVPVGFASLLSSCDLSAHCLMTSLHPLIINETTAWLTLLPPSMQNPLVFQVCSTQTPSSFLGSQTPQAGHKGDTKRDTSWTENALCDAHLQAW